MTLKNSILAATLGTYTPAGPGGPVQNNFSLAYMEPVFANSYPHWYMENWINTDQGATISRDGKYILIMDIQGSKYAVEQWETEYPWAFATAANTNNIANLNVIGLHKAQGGQVGYSPWSIYLNSTGTRLYWMCETYDRLYQGNISTPYNLSTLSWKDTDWKYDPYNIGNSFIGAPVGVPGFTWSDDGTKVYIITSNDTTPTGRRIFSYTATTPHEVANIRFDGRHTFPQFQFDATLTEQPTDKGTFRMIGSKWYWTRTQVRDQLLMVDLPCGEEGAFDLITEHSTTSSATNHDINRVDTTTAAAFINPALDKFITIGNANGNIAYWTYTNSNLAQYSLVAERNFTRANSQVVRSFGACNTQTFWVTSNGEYIVSHHASVQNGESGDRFMVHRMSTAWDGTTAEWLGRNTYPRLYVTAADGTASGDSTTTGFHWGDSGMTLLTQGTTLDWVFQFEQKGLPYTLGWVRFTNRFNTSAQDLNAHCCRWKSDGTSFYFMGNTGDDINQYNMSVAWDITTATFITSFSITANESNPKGLWFKNDGTRVYYTGDVSDRVWQRDLGTAWDVSSISGTATSFLVSTQETIPSAVTLSDDGTKMYVTGTSGNDVNRYNLGTAWDVTTASYQSIWGNSTILGTAHRDMGFDSTGEHFYIMQGSLQYIDRHKLNTPYVVAAAGTADAPLFSYYGNTRQGVGYYMTFGTQLNVGGIVGKDSGDRLWVGSAGTSSSGSTREYWMANTWDFHWNSVTPANLRLHNQVIHPSIYSAAGTSGCWSLNMKSDGTALYWQSSADYSIWRIPLANAWDFSSTLSLGACTIVGPGNALYSPGCLYVGNPGPGTASGVNGVSTPPFYSSGFNAKLAISPDASNIYLYSVNNTSMPTVWQIDLGSAGNIETVTTITATNVYPKYWNDALTYADISVTPRALNVSNDGTVFWLQSDTGFITKFNATTPFVFDSVVKANIRSGEGYQVLGERADPGYIQTNPQIFDVSSDGQYMYVLDSTNAWAVTYFLSTPWLVNTASFVRTTSTLPQGPTTLTDFRIHPDGTSYYTVSTTQDNVMQRTGLTEAWNLDTYTSEANLRVNAQTTNPYGIAFKPDGTRLYVMNGTTINPIYAYDLSTAWDVTTASLVQTSVDFNLLTGVGDIYNFTWANSGTRMYFSTPLSPDQVWEVDFSTSAWDLPTSTGQCTQNFYLYTDPQTNAVLYGQTPSAAIMRESSLGKVVFSPLGDKMLIMGANQAAVWAFKAT